MSTEVIAVTKPGTSSTEFNNLVNQLKVDDGVVVSDQANLEAIDFRFFVADLNSCQVKDLLNNSIIRTVVLNSQVKLHGLVEDNSNSKRGLSDSVRAAAAAAAAAAATANLTRKARRDWRRSEPGSGRPPEKRAGPEFKQVVGLSNGPDSLLIRSPYQLDWLTVPALNKAQHANTCMCAFLQSLSRPAAGLPSRLLHCC